MLGPLAANVYIGLYDANLPTYSMLHYYLNWTIVAVDLVAMLILILRPRSPVWVTMSGIAWPFVYFASLAVDVETTLCLGTGVNCWPSANAAFQYLILGSAKQGWGLWPYTMEFSIGLLVVVIVLASITVKKQRRFSQMAKLQEKSTAASQK